MTIALREATPEDEEAILALRARCFGNDDPEKGDRRFRAWEFRDGRAFVADAGGRLASHIAFVAQPHLVLGQRVRGMLAVDAMTDAEFRGQRLLARVATYAASLLANDAAFSTAWQIRKPVLGSMLAGGWRMAGGARVLLRPVLPRAAERIGRADAGEMSAIASEFFAATEAHVDRTADYLRWRYLENPSWQYDIAMSERAWIATRETKLKGIRTLAIADVAWRKGQASEAVRLLKRAMSRTTAALAATMVTRDHPAFWWFIRRGFVPGPHRFRLLVNDFSLGGSPRWALAWGDTDHL